MAAPVWATNDVPTATDFNVWLTNIITAIKGSDESLISNTTLQDDNDLSVTVAANSVYELSYMIIYEAGTVGDIKFRWVGPASATLQFAANRLLVTAAGVNDDTVSSDPINTVVTAGGQGSGFTLAIEGKGLLRVAGTAGTFKLQWAQDTSSSGATIVKADSFMVLRRIS
jgi:hypothetical protein